MPTGVHIGNVTCCAILASLIQGTLVALALAFDTVMYNFYAPVECGCVANLETSLQRKTHAMPQVCAVNAPYKRHAHTDTRVDAQELTGNPNISHTIIHTK